MMIAASWWADMAGAGISRPLYTGERMQSRVRSLVQGETMTNAKHRYIVVTECRHFSKPTEFKHRSYARKQDALDAVRRCKPDGLMLQRAIKYIIDRENPGFHVIP
jgi:hypothetical protein